ncbi:MAG: ABC transporter substrate-binding protein [Candidatus Dormibacteraeota bacterium]|nr:ABC transporter substrate-binding protein [Candidatus Dormibacteraeota bacterium]
MSGRLVAALVGCLLVISACGTGAARKSPTGLRGIVRIALVNVFSGSPSYLGEYTQNSLQVQVDAINASGGLLGSRLEVVAADDEQKLDKGAELVREQLTEGDVKLLVGPSTSSVALAAQPVINAARTPNCALDLNADALSKSPFTFRIQERDGDRIGALLGYILRSRSEIKRVGLVSDGDPSTQAYDAQLRDQASRFGLQYVGSFGGAGTTDQRSAVQQLLAKGAQAAVLPANPGAAGRTVAAVTQLGVSNQLQMLGTSGLGAYSFPKETGDGVSGLVFESTIQSYLSDVPEARWPPPYAAFFHKITSQYGYASNGVEMKGLPAAADCVVEWSRAVRAAGRFDGPAVVRAWENLDLAPDQTVLGAHEKLAPGNHDALGPDGVYVYQWVKNGDRWALKQLAGPHL